MKDNKLKEILAKVKSFPTMPGAGAKMLALLQEQEPELGEIEENLTLRSGVNRQCSQAGKFGLFWYSLKNRFSESGGHSAGFKASHQAGGGILRECRDG